jgi:hypothetical protein
MAAKKKILASDVYIGNLSVEGRILALDERIDATLDRISEQNRLLEQRIEQHEHEIEQHRLESQELLKALMLMARQNETRFSKLEAPAPAG